MVMLYLDESSSFGKQDFVCVAGYLSSDESWAAFAEEWRILLKKHGITSFHTSDFMAGEGPYKSLALTREARVTVLKEFMSPIRKHIHSGFGVGVDAKRFREITKDVKKHVRPEIFCFQRIMRLVSIRLGDWNVDNFELFFDDNKDYSMKVYKFICMLEEIDPIARNRISSIAFGKDEKWPPLQAADILSCATAREHRFGFGSNAWSVDHSIFHPILYEDGPAYGKPYFSEYWDKEELDKQADKIRSATLAEY
jgi:hypothetical protein